MGNKQPHAFFSFYVAIGVRAKTMNHKTNETKPIFILASQVDVRLGLRVGEEILKNREVSKHANTTQGVSDEFCSLGRGEA